MKRNNKKGFTLVELVIVIAVIAILAAVLIPTFSKVIEKANASAAEQEARNIYTEYVLTVAEQGEYVDDCWIKTAKGYYVQYVKGVMQVESSYSTTAPDDLWSTAPTATDTDQNGFLKVADLDVWVAHTVPATE